MPKKVLLVDDSATSRVLHRSIVANRGYAVVCAKDGVQALQLANTEKPDLILMDVMMPGLSGLEVCQRLRKQSETSEIPIVLLTFRIAEESERAGFDSGCNAYLKKPVQEAELVKTLRSYLGE